ncbi:MAG: tRNA (cytosine(32)/uridine(32)-2'-O)-methyltransferase TrmJ [Proteobacteria bacterium]|nr:MAG: tRNA (cytosine(32)/uridine(32)-2'-O)-methyltransferase TrmJ [Pseudomonadota bacterium]
MLENIRIVLVRTYHAGNIGSSIRAMKTMGLSQLVLVEPRDYPSEKANKMASSAEDLLAQTQVVDSLYEAVQGCELVIACTARPRTFDLPVMEPSQAAATLYQTATKSPVALVFGPERMGLHNDDIQLAHYRATIPANPEYSSLNLASAVQILCYELRKQVMNDERVMGEVAQETRLLPSIAQRENFYETLEAVLNDSGFVNQQHPGQLMLKLRRFFARAEMDASELNILRGALAAIQRKMQD